ncbi:hypothetical protein KIPB_004042, partial [Kipferlia bialata]|eukprot:g4042.t1
MVDLGLLSRLRKGVSSPNSA